MIRPICLIYRLTGVFVYKHLFPFSNVLSRSTFQVRFALLFFARLSFRIDTYQYGVESQCSLWKLCATYTDLW